MSDRLRIGNDVSAVFGFALNFAVLFFVVCVEFVAVFYCFSVYLHVFRLRFCEFVLCLCFSVFLLVFLLFVVEMCRVLSFCACFFCVTVCLRCLCLRFLYFKIVGCEKVSGVRVSWWGAKNVWC